MDKLNVSRRMVDIVEALLIAFAMVLMLIAPASAASSADLDDPEYILRNSYVATASIKIRSSASNKGKIKGYVKPQTSFVAEKHKGGWVYARFGKVKGWVYSSWTAKVNPRYTEKVKIRVQTYGYKDVNRTTKAKKLKKNTAAVVVGPNTKSGKVWTTPVKVGGVVMHVKTADILYRG